MGSRLTRERLNREKLPNRVLQFGEGNFLRCFIDWQLDILNEDHDLDFGVVVVRPIDTPVPPSLNIQDGLYTTILRGYDDQGSLRDDRRVVSCVNRELSVYHEYEEFLSLAHNPELSLIVSNTTEAGIIYKPEDTYDDAPPGSFPAKLTRFLHERFLAFDASPEAGLTLIPCELIDYNGERLREIVLMYADLWQLGDQFVSWVKCALTFCSTLVDRIVTGYPRQEIEQIQEELGYEDQFLTTGEFFHLFVIQGPESLKELLKLPHDRLNIQIVPDLGPYKLRKVGILNGCHTALVPIAYLQGFELVREAMNDEIISRFLSSLLEYEIIPNLSLPKNELEAYADSVIDRFRNPYIDHKLLDISLNSMTKFKTRLLPQLVRHYETNGNVPPLISLALAALICFYRGEIDGKSYPVRDDRFLTELLAELWESPLNSEKDAFKVIDPILELESHWEYPLHSIPGLREKLARDLYKIATKGMTETLKEYHRETVVQD